MTDFEIPIVSSSRLNPSQTSLVPIDSADAVDATEPSWRPPRTSFRYLSSFLIIMRCDELYYIRMVTKVASAVTFLLA